MSMDASWLIIPIFPLLSPSDCFVKNFLTYYICNTAHCASISDNHAEYCHLKLFELFPVPATKSPLAGGI